MGHDRIKRDTELDLSSQEFLNSLHVLRCYILQRAFLTTMVIHRGAHSEGHAIHRAYHATS